MGISQLNYKIFNCKGNFMQVSATKTGKYFHFTEIFVAVTVSSLIHIQSP